VAPGFLAVSPPCSGGILRVEAGGDDAAGERVAAAHQAREIDLVPAGPPEDHFNRRPCPVTQGHRPGETADPRGLPVTDGLERSYGAVTHVPEDEVAGPGVFEHSARVGLVGGTCGLHRSANGGAGEQVVGPVDLASCGRSPAIAIARKRLRIGGRHGQDSGVLDNDAGEKTEAPFAARGGREPRRDKVSDDAG